MQQAGTNQRYKGIDILKFFCLFLVIMIHVTPCGGGIESITNYVLQKIIARISVPFFFTASGFLLFRKFENDSYDVEKVKRFLLYTLRLYVVWTIIYSPFIIHGIITDEKGIGRGVLYQ